MKIKINLIAKKQIGKAGLTRVLRFELILDNKTFLHKFVFRNCFGILSYLLNFFTKFISNTLKAPI